MGIKYIKKFHLLFSIDNIEYGYIEVNGDRYKYQTVKRERHGNRVTRRQKIKHDDFIEALKLFNSN